MNEPAQNTPPPDAACERPAITALVTGFLSLGAVLVVLGLLYA